MRLYGENKAEECRQKENFCKMCCGYHIGMSLTNKLTECNFKCESVITDGDKKVVKPTQPAGETKETSEESAKKQEGSDSKPSAKKNKRKAPKTKVKNPKTKTKTKTQTKSKPKKQRSGKAKATQKMKNFFKD